jgi:sulfur carrier protein
MSNSDLTLTINQVPHRLPAGSSLLDAVQRVGIQPPFAAAVNLEFVPRGQYASRLLADGDQVELIAPITGG